MRIRFTVLTALFAANAFAVAPQFWRVHSIEDFLAGDVDGFAVTSRGELRAGPSLRKIATFSDPFVLAQVSAPGGDRFFGTGNDGKVYRLRGTELKTIHTAPEPEIYALAFHKGALYAASSPNGKIYRVDPESGKSTVFYDPKQAYIWALQFAGDDLLVGTGVEGKLFRVDPKGEGKLLFTVPEAHVRSLAVKKDGTVLAGGSGQGRIYEVRADGMTHALYDSALTEISAIYVDPNGVGWAAGVSGTLPATAPAAKPAAKPAQPAGATGAAAAGASAEASKDSEAKPGADSSFSFADTTPAGQTGSGELYRINPDGFVEVVRKFDREMIYSLAGGPDGSILLATGPQGRVYSYKADEMALVSAVPEKQIVSISSEGGATTITTTNSGAVYRVENTPSPKAEFRSAVKDIEHFSRFGQYRVEGQNVGDGHLAISFRSGNTRAADSTWSSWTTPSVTPAGTIGAPPGRYIQWKLTMPRPAANVSVDSLVVAFINRNVAPVIDSLIVQDPAVVFIGASYPASPQVVEATNPDEYGIFTSLDSPRERTDQGGKKVYRKGFRTFNWRAHDENGDALRYSLSFRQKGTDKWLRLRDNLDETQMNFDTSQIPDGTYELRLEATDANDNPDTPLADTREGIEFSVDNAPPAIAVTTDANDVIIRVTDKLSTVGKVEYSIDAQKWTRLVPVDGIADSGDETYRVRRGEVAGKYVIVRAVDAFYNVATISITLP